MLEFIKYRLRICDFRPIEPLTIHLDLGPGGSVYLGPFALSFFLPAMTFASVAFAQQYVPGEVIVRLKSQNGSSETYTFMDKVHSDKAMTLRRAWPRMSLYHYAIPKGQSVESAVADLKSDSNVLYAEPNYLIHKTSTSGVQSTFSASQIKTLSAQSQTTYLATSANIGVQSVWSADVASANPKTVVAVIDTGLDTTHPVMTGTNAVWTNPNEIPGNGIDDDGNGYIDDVHGWNFVDNSPTMYDDDSHGTHVSGIILSVDQNIYSTPLHDANIRIMPLKFLNGSGVGSASDAISAIYYAVDNGAAILNNSWGGPDYSTALAEAIAFTYTKGVLFVAAAGNNGTSNDSTPMYPANYDTPNVLAVAATTDADYIASFSNFGPSTVPLGSPGVFILSTIPNDSFGTMSGTSMATPFVTGTAAQMRFAAPGMLGYQLKSILQGQVSSIPQLVNLVTTAGRLDSATSVASARVATIETSQPAYTLTLQPDRQLASDLTGAGAGCGIVKVLGSDSDSNGAPPLGAAAVIVGLVLLPLLMLVMLRSRAPENRRKYERFKLDSDVRISVGDRELVGSISSLSLGGAQVNTSALLQDGGLITMTISSPNGDEKVEVAGRVVWSAANKAYGVAFDQAPQSALARFTEWTKGLKSH
jgi:subtilisin family serine protease